MASPRYRFGDFEIDAGGFELSRRGRTIELQPKPLEVLLYLVRHRDRIVSRQELLAELWRGVTVSEDSLDKAISASRRALGDAGATQSCIRTIRGRGFRFVASVDEVGATPAAAPAAMPATACEENDFVGRDEVLSRIAAAIDGATAGRGRLLLLAGEPGMGKTRTAQEAAARARRAGVRVLAGWCHEDEAAPSLWPWLHVLRPLAAERDPTGLARELGDAAGDLAKLLPALREPLRVAGRSVHVDRQQARYRLLDALVELVKHATREAVCSIFLDDFHWADAASLALLGMLTRELAETRLVLLVTHRSSGLPPGHALTELARRPECEPLTLAGLERTEVGRLVAAVRGQPVDEAAVAAIHERTEGNPFFVRELSRDLATSSARGARSSLPAGVRDVVRRRLDQLSAPCRAILGTAATVGREFLVDLLASLSTLEDARILEILDEAVAAQIVVPVAGGHRFAHALVREALLDELPSAERIRLHHRIALALEERCAGDTDDHLAELAHHFHAGALSGDRERALDYLRRAGARAASLFAHEEAIEHYRKALDVWAMLDEPPQLVRCDLLLALGEAQVSAGRTDEGRATLRAAGDLARRLSLPDRLARVALSYGGLEFSVEAWIEDPDLVARLEEALAASSPDDPLRVRLLVRLSVALSWVGEGKRAAALIEEAVAAARRLGAAEPLAHALYVHRWSLVGPGDLAARLADSDEIMRLARESGSRELELVARSCRFLDLLEIGRIVEADRELAAYERLAETLRMPRYRWRAGFYRAMRLLLEGRFAETEALALRDLSGADAFRPADASLVSGPQLLVVRLEQGRIADLEPVLRDFAQRFPNVPTWRANLALFHAELGRTAEARELLAALADDDFRMLTRPLLGIVSLVLLGETCALLGDAPRARALYDVLAPYAPRTVMVGAGVVCLGSLDLYLGRLAAAFGGESAARRHLEAALAMNERLGALPWIAWAHYELARLDAARRGREHVARRHLERAGQIASALGMARLASRLERLSASPSR